MKREERERADPGMESPDPATDEAEEAGDDLGVGSCKMGRHLEQRESTGEKRRREGATWGWRRRSSSAAAGLSLWVLWMDLANGRRSNGAG